MRKTAGFMQIYAIGGIAIAVLAGLLYWQIRANGTLLARNDELIEANQHNKAEVQRLQSMQQLSEVVVLELAGKRETIRDEVEVTKYEIREIVKSVPAGDCLNQPMPDSVVQLLAGAGGDRDD